MFSECMNGQCDLLQYLNNFRRKGWGTTGSLPKETANIITLGNFYRDVAKIVRSGDDNYWDPLGSDHRSLLYLSKFDFQFELTLIGLFA